MFGCKVRWIYSIGYAVRNDVKYPDITAFGNNEAERRFNYFTNKYSKIQDFMSHFTLIENQYGTGSTWVCSFVAKRQTTLTLLSRRPSASSSPIKPKWSPVLVGSLSATALGSRTHSTRPVSRPRWRPARMLLNLRGKHFRRRLRRSATRCGSRTMSGVPRLSLLSIR